VGILPFTTDLIPLTSTVNSSTQEVPYTFTDTSSSELKTNNQKLNQPRNLASNIPLPAGSTPFLSLGNLLVLHGDYVNESGQEPVEAWTSLFHNLGFNTTTDHVDNFIQSSDFDLIIVTPSVGTKDTSFGVSMANAEQIGNCSQPILLLGSGHEVLDRLYGFNPILDFIPSIERYLWSSEKTQQIFSNPHAIPLASGRFGIYATHVSYDAYRISSLPAKTEVLGTNYAESGAQLLWIRAYPINSQIYYWGIDQVRNLNQYGRQFCENLIHWIIRPTLQQRLSETLSAWQLPLGSDEAYWAIQGGGGFGYPLEPSLRFSYYVTDMVSAFSLAVNLTNFDTWLLECYNSELGCFEDMASPQFQDRCVTTAMSVLMADDLGVLNQLNHTQIGNYLKSCYDSTSGGFFTEHGSSQTSLTATRYAIQSLFVLGQISTLNTQSIINYISNCQELNPQNSEYGGFYSADTGGLSTSLVQAADALIALDVLTALNAINLTALLDFITNCEDPSGSAIFDTRCTMGSNEWIVGTSCVIQILTILNLQELYDTSASREFILANQYPNGGWGRGDLQHDFHDSPDETWYGTQALLLTGGLDTTEYNLTTYLNHCCTGWGGASEPTIFGDFLTGVEIILALSQVDALHSLNLTAYLEYLENSWSQSRNSFIAHQLPSIIGIDTDTPTPDRTTIQVATFGPLYHYSYGRLLSTLNLTGAPWTIFATQLLHEIESCQSDAIGYAGMIGLHHLYVGQESDLTFRFDTTCWNLIAHEILGGAPTDLDNSTAVLSYLSGCLHTNTTQQFFHDALHSVPIPAPWSEAEGYLAETWLGLQAYSYLNPALTNLDGEKLASYVMKYLNENTSITTIFYATEILNLLVETDLNPNAFNLPNWHGLKTKILNSFTYNGLVNDASLPPGKWMPSLVNLGLRLIHRLKLLPQLDVNPLLNLTDIAFPTGALYPGGNFTLSATLVETRWGHLPPTIQTQTQIFNSTFINSCHIPRSGFFEIYFIIPLTLRVLGPQNLSLIVFHPRAIPHYSSFYDICIREAVTPTLTLSVTPHEIDNRFLHPTLELVTRLSYLNDSLDHGITANLTVQIYSQDSLLPIELLIVTDSSGSGNLTITTPEPGLYTVTVLFEGKRGFAPCSATTPLLIRYSSDFLGDVFSLFLFSSVVVLIIGLITGLLGFSRIQKRLNEFLQRIQPRQETLPDTSTSLLLTGSHAVSEDENEEIVKFGEE
jgi:prenyltransferase beta subunit